VIAARPGSSYRPLSLIIDSETEPAHIPGRDGHRHHSLPAEAPPRKRAKAAPLTGPAIVVRKWPEPGQAGGAASFSSLSTCDWLAVCGGK
jgi:hypothetical protein